MTRRSVQGTGIDLLERNGPKLVGVTHKTNKLNVYLTPYRSNYEFIYNLIKFNCLDHF